MTAMTSRRWLGAVAVAAVLVAFADRASAQVGPKADPNKLVTRTYSLKPILGDKIRYHLDPAFTKRLMPPPVVPLLDMPLHIAKAQGRIRDMTDDELGDGQVDLTRVAHQISPTLWRSM